ncbi:hypothetical protein A9Y76_07100 [Ralstonia insidiosa]|uniref:Uncharacterized protein n=1 Tax=Ralstonia insidiosa TaxID=190721 RepID=A0A191ZVR4_9RALS|nr:hypothetical protein A9Y76_07100 [Ralstonia insidiosa]
MLENNQKVSVNAISELTGIKAPTLYTFPEVRQHTRKHKKRGPGKSKVTVASKPISKDDIEQSVEGYIQYIKDCYFTHAEGINDVMTDMMTSVHDFSSSLFHQAVNKLQALGELKASPIMHGKYIGSFTKEEVKTVAPAIEQDPELDRILTSCETDNPFNEPEPVKPAKKVKEKPKSEPYELRFQMPLSSGYFLMSFPSDIDDEDKQDISDYLALVMKRKLKI